MFEDLGRLDPRLMGITAIRGVGLSSNIYVIKAEEVTLIDTGVGNEHNRLDRTLEQLHIPMQSVRHVILTHAHADHFGGLLTIQSLTSPRILVHKLDGHAPEEVDTKRITWINEGDTVNASGRRLKVVHTPGHTAGSICLFDEANKTLFSGDTVFPDGLFGRTDLPTGDAQALVDSLKKLTRLDVESLLAGHERSVIHDGSSQMRLSYEVAQSFFG